MKKHNSSTLTLLALFASMASLFISLKKNEPRVSPISLPTQSEAPHTKELHCPDNHYLSGITSSQEAICHPLDSGIASERPQPMNQPITSFVGGWTVGDICTFKENSTHPVESCKVPNFDTIPECTGATRPSIVNISKQRKAFFPTPCLKHLDSCYITNVNNNHIQRIYLSCRTYKVLTTEN